MFEVQVDGGASQKSKMLELDLEQFSMRNKMAEATGKKQSKEGKTKSIDRQNLVKEWLNMCPVVDEKQRKDKIAFEEEISIKIPSKRSCKKSPNKEVELNSQDSFNMLIRSDVSSMNHVSASANESVNVVEHEQQQHKFSEQLWLSIDHDHSVNSVNKSGDEQTGDIHA